MLTQADAGSGTAALGIRQRNPYRRRPFSGAYRVNGRCQPLPRGSWPGGFGAAKELRAGAWTPPERRRRAMAGCGAALGTVLDEVEVEGGRGRARGRCLLAGKGQVVVGVVRRCSVPAVDSRAFPIAPDGRGQRAESVAIRETSYRRGWGMRTSSPSFVEGWPAGIAPSPCPHEKGPSSTVYPHFLIYRCERPALYHLSGCPSLARLR